MTVPGPTLQAPTALRDRVLAPDLARGAMLLLIALANSHVYLHGHAVGIRGYPLQGSAADRVVAWFLASFVDGRAYPLFGLLFGYGLVQLGRRLATSGADEPQARRLLRRRARWLLLLGLAHAALLFSGDILGAYGLLALVLAGRVLGSDDRRLLVLGLWWLVPVAVMGMGQGAPMPPGAETFLPSMGTTDPLLAVGIRLVEWLGLTLFMVLSLAAAVLLGAWAGRLRVLEEPEARRRLLRRGAVGGLALAVLGGQPMALMAAGVWQDPGVLAGLTAGVLHTVSGYAGGLGYACCAGLVAVAVRDRRGPVVEALVACGQRSLSCYLAQSVVFVALLAPYGGGLGDRIGLAGVAAVAATTWTVILLVAAVAGRRGVRGPFEVLLRRLTYGRAR